MSAVILKQTVHPNLRAFVIYPMFVVFTAIIYMDPMNFYILGLPVLLLNYGFAYVFDSDKKTYISLTIFGYSMLRFPKRFMLPEYISLFEECFVRGNGLGFYPQIQGDSKYSLYVIKLFKGYEREIVFESNSKEDTLELRTKLAALLDVRLHNTLE